MPSCSGIRTTNQALGAELGHTSNSRHQFATNRQLDRGFEKLRYAWLGKKMRLAILADLVFWNPILEGLQLLVIDDICVCGTGRGARLGNDTDETLNVAGNWVLAHQQGYSVAREVGLAICRLFD